MDQKIWKNLPTELIRKIIEASEPSIDVQLCFKIPPKKIDEAKAWRLWYLLKSHDGIIYNLETESLHIFRVPGLHIIRRPIKLDWVQDHMWCFNEGGEDHTIEYVAPCGCFISEITSASWITEMRVLLRGSGLARVIAATDLTF